MKKRKKEMYDKNAYFTVEAALIVPVVMSTMFLVIYLLLFQYNRCLLEQDLGAMAIWGSETEVSDEEIFEEKIRERIGEIYRDKYVAWEITTLNVTLQNNNFLVEGGGQLTFPFAGWNFWSTNNIWETKIDYSCRRTSPVTFIRLCRRIHSRVEKGSEVDNSSESSEDRKDGEKL